MRFRSGMIFAISAVIALGGCAAGAAGGGGPPVSPTGKVYEPGIAPRQTAESRNATIAIATGQFDEAMAPARAGIEADPENPIHYYLAGEAAAGMGDYALADSLWRVAESIYPAYELEIEPTREQYWTQAFNEGVEAYNAGDMSTAIEAWSRAHMIYRLRPDAAQNLGVLYTQEARYDEAIEVYREGLESFDLEPAARIIGEEEEAERAESRAALEASLVQLYLFTDSFAEAESLLREMIAENPDDVELQANLATALAGLGRSAEAGEIYTRLLAEPNLGPTQLFNIGVSLFNAGETIQAAEAFGRVTQLLPNSRDAWYNQANALYGAEAWEELAPVAARHVQVDPLSETAILIQARAFRELGQNDDALRALESVETLPVFVEDLQLSPAGESTTVRGRVIGNTAPVGTPIQIRFTFYGDNGNEVGNETVTVNAPAAEQSVPLEVTVDAPASAYRYALVQ